MSAPSLTFLHTSPIHVATFGALLAELAPEIPVRHIIEESLLERARQSGMDAVTSRLRELISELEGRASVLVCTCSTIGNAAEALSSERLPVMRIDRPLAEAAVRAGRNGVLCRRSSPGGPEMLRAAQHDNLNPCHPERSEGSNVAWEIASPSEEVVQISKSPYGTVLVMAALDSTLEPTRAQVENAAQELNMPADIQTRLCHGAWKSFEAGDLTGYIRRITAELDTLPEPLPAVVVLAQASMAPAAAHTKLTIPVLSSPRLGAQAAVALYRARVAPPT